MSYFALAGFDTQQIMDALGPTLNLAAAGQIEIAEAADIAAKIMSGMGIDAADLGNAIDVMAKAMTTANTDLTMLGEAFKFVGPMAKTAGVSLEEITAAIQLLSNAGIQGEMAGTTLRGMLLSLTSPSSEAKRELDRLGVSVTDSAGNVRSLAAIIGDLESSLAGAGSGERLRVLGTIFPARQAAGAAELISQGAARLEEATAALGTASGTAANIAGTQLDTLRGDATILMSALEGLGIAVGEALGDSLRTGIQAITGLLSILAQWVSENRAVVMTVVGIIAGVALIGGALVSLGIALQITAFGFAGLATAIGLVGSLIGALLSPIGLLVGLVVALGAYLLYTSEAGGQALAWLGERFSILKDDATKAWGAIGKALASGDIALAGRILWLTLKMEWQRGIHFLNGLWVKFKEFFLAMTTDAVFGAAKIINDGWSGVEVAWTETVGFLADAWSLFVNGLTKTWHSTIGFIRKAWVRLKSLFDSEIDVNAEVNRINAETDAAYQNADDQMLEAVGQRDQERRDRRQQIERDRKATGDTLTQMQQAEHEQRQRGFNDDLAKTESELAKARDEWQAAMAEVEQTTPADTSTPEGKKLKELQHSLALGAGVVGDQQNKVEVKGTFNALGARGLGSDSLAERTARASEQIVINTQELLDEAKQGGLVFGQ
ncbi:MAG: phage tail tape measure protein [Pirellulaceae bacterium]